MTEAPGGAGPAVLGFAMPAVRRGQKLQFSFDEDELSLAWEALRMAGLPRGTTVHAVGLAVPPWFWAGMGLSSSAEATHTLAAVATTAGPCVAVVAGTTVPDVEPAARRRLESAPVRSEAEWQRHRTARDAPDTENDFPLGAYVTPLRHEAVTQARMSCPPLRIASWTTIGAGAAPTEFLRLQEAVGPYHVVLAEDEAGARTVGIWTEPQPPVTLGRCQPVLRRLFRMQGAWRHGIKFAPAPAGPRVPG